MPLFDDSVSANLAYCNIRDLPFRRPVRDVLESAWTDYQHLVPDRSQYPREFRDDFHARAWELLLIRAFSLAGLVLEPPPSSNAPDILVRLGDGRACWVECVVPRPGQQAGIPMARRSTGRVLPGEIPEEPVLLRYTSVLTTKFNAFARYRDEGRIAADDMTFVAVYQDCLPLSWVHDAYVPAIAKVLFGLGEEQLVVPLDHGVPLLREADIRITQRSAIHKNGSVPIPSSYFVDPGTEHVSGVIAAKDYIANCDRIPLAPLVVMHNPLASVPAPRRLLPCRGEMWVEGHRLVRDGVCSMSDDR